MQSIYYRVLRPFNVPSTAPIDNVAKKCNDKPHYTKVREKIVHLLTELESQLFEASISRFLVAVQLSAEILQVFQSNYTYYVNLLYLLDYPEGRPAPGQECITEVLVTCLYNNAIYPTQFEQQDPYVSRVLAGINKGQAFTLCLDDIPLRLRSTAITHGRTVRMQFHRTYFFRTSIEQSRDIAKKAIPDFNQPIDCNAYFQSLVHYISGKLGELGIWLDKTLPFDHRQLLATISRDCGTQGAQYHQFVELENLFPIVQNVQIVNDFKDHLVLPQKYNIFLINDRIVIQLQFNNKLKRLTTISPQNFNYDYNLKLFLDQMLVKGGDNLFDLLKNICIQSLYYTSCELDEQKYISIKLEVPSSICYRDAPHTDSATYKINQLLQLEYRYQYLFTRLSCEYYLLNRFFIDQIQEDKIVPIMRDNINSQEYQYLAHIAPMLTKYHLVSFLTLQTIDSCVLLVIQLVESYKVLNVQAVMSYTLINLGFLTHQHNMYNLVVKKQENYFQLRKFDHQLTLRHVFLDLRQFSAQHVISINPRLLAFCRQTCSAASILHLDFQTLRAGDDIALYALVALLHEIQYNCTKAIKIRIDGKYPITYQILSGIANYSPLSACLQLSFDNQLGVDTGGMTKAAIQQISDELLSEVELTTGVVNFLEQRHPKVQFQPPSQQVPHLQSILHVFTGAHQSKLYPHYEYKTLQSTVQVMPRLTRMKSCLFYLGRLLAFCLVYNYQFPDIFGECMKGVLNSGRFTPDGTENSGTNEYQNPDTPQHPLIYRKQIATLGNIASKADLERIFGRPVSISDDQVLAYRNEQLHRITSGAAFTKSLQELRNGFRQALCKDQRVDLLLSKVSANGLCQLVFAQEVPQHIANQDQIALDLFRGNFQVYCNELDKFTAVQILASAFGKMSYPDLLDAVYCITGVRQLYQNSINVQFTASSHDLCVFHVCNNQLDVCLEWFVTWTQEKVMQWVLRSVRMALGGGWGVV